MYVVYSSLFYANQINRYMCWYLYY